MDERDMRNPEMALTTPRPPVRPVPLGYLQGEEIGEPRNPSGFVLVKRPDKRGGSHGGQDSTRG